MRTAQAGVQQVSPFNDSTAIYVPEQCVGTRRCPLVVGLLNGRGQPLEVITGCSQFADKYGIILFVPAMAAPERLWDAHRAFRAKQQQGLDARGLKRAVLPGAFDNVDVRRIDAALKSILQNFAIDPDKIGLLGFSYGASYALYLGRHNLDIFSRIAVLSPTGNWGGTGPQNTTTQFWFSSGTREADEVVQAAFRAAQELRQAGHPVTQRFFRRGHVRGPAEESEPIWRWFHEHWAVPRDTVQAETNAVADSVPILTTDIVTRLTSFWQNFVPAAEKFPDSVAMRSTVIAVMFPAHPHKPARLLVGQQPVVIDQMIDMVGIAAEHPWLDTALGKAGLTARQEKVYRAALISAIITRKAGEAAGPMAPSSALAKNVAFIGQHQTAVATLRGKMGID